MQLPITICFSSTGHWQLKLACSWCIPLLKVDLITATVWWQVWLIYQLQSVLRTSARLVLQLGKFDPHHNYDIQEKLHWLPIWQRMYKLCLLFFKCFHVEVLQYLSDMLLSNARPFVQLHILSFGVFCIIELFTSNTEWTEKCKLYTMSLQVTIEDQFACSGIWILAFMICQICTCALAMDYIYNGALYKYFLNFEFWIDVKYQNCLHHFRFASRCR